MGYRSCGRVLAALLAAGFIATAAGCQSDDSADVIDPDTGGQEVPEGKILQSELRAYCPQVTLRENNAFLRTYAKNAEGDPSKLMYQSSLSVATRKCTYGSGTLTMNIAVAGKVVPGPLAADGVVKMPIRVMVLRGTEVVYDNVANHEVAVSRASGATQFIYNDPNVAIPTPEPGSIQAYVGYDLPETKKKDEDAL